MPAARLARAGRRGIPGRPVKSLSQYGDVDPWVRTQIRLAERQGLLSGRGLSLLQVTAVYFCEIESMVDQTEERRQGFKYALLSTGRYPADELFPGVFDKVEDDDSAEFDDDEDSVTYRFADHGELSAEDMERELQALMAGGDFTVNGSEVSDGPPKPPLR